MADGGFHWFESHGLPWFAGQDEYRGHVGMSIDVNEAVQAEEALRTADRRKDEFLATLAHELRNPLAPISNALQLLRLPEGRRRIDSLLEMTGRQVKQMVRLVDDLMEVTRITRGKIDLRRVPVPLADILYSAVETSQPEVDRKRHRLTLTLPPDELVLDGDQVRLTQVFANLLNNAAKYTAPGGDLHLSARREGDDVVVVLRDNGKGIPAEQLPLIFDMFSQPHGDCGRTESGLGIGLAMVRSLVHLHDGAVEAHSAGPGQGSEFLVRLPLRRDDAAAGQVPQAPADEPTAPLAGQCVLVVDDNRDAADSLCELLSAQGARASAVYGGRAAIETLATMHPDAIVLDIGMPDIDGYAVASRIREEGRHNGVRIIALTGWGQHADRLRTEACGFDHHLTKPPDLNVLQALLTRH
jgi:CheY-like chemotaxis protein/PAS domain-containing protein